MSILEKLIGKNDDEDPHSQNGKDGKNTQNAQDKKRGGLFGNKRQGRKENKPPVSKDTERIFEEVRNFQEMSAKEIMIPRVDVDFIDKNSSIEELQSAVAHSTHSRLPVYKETPDQIVGILHAKDLLSCLAEKKPFEIAEIYREPYFVPESMKLHKLLEEFQKRHIHIAMVIDEYGGTSGIICLEDILEEIVGDIQDEFDKEGEAVTTLEEGVHVCGARLNISDLNEELNLDLPTDDCDTVGGFVFSLCGKVPSRYERIRYKNIEFIVQKLEGHRIESIKIIVLAKTKENSSASPS